MAIKTFTTANVKIGGTGGTVIGNVESAQLTVNFDTAEITSFGDSWKKYLGLAKGWQVTVSAKYDNSDAGATALRTEWASGDNFITSLTLYENSSSIYSGDVYMTSYVEGANVNGLDTYSVTFQGSSSLSYTP